MLLILHFQENALCNYDSYGSFLDLYTGSFIFKIFGVELNIYFCKKFKVNYMDTPKVSPFYYNLIHCSFFVFLHMFYYYCMGYSSIIFNLKINIL